MRQPSTRLASLPHQMFILVPLLGDWGKEKYGGLIKRVDAFDQ